MSIDETDLLAYVDGQLSPERLAEVQAAIARSAHLQARLAAMRASVLPYAAAFEQQELPPVPPQLSQRVADLISDFDSRQRRRSSWQPLAASFAAGVLCCALALKLVSPGAAPSSAARVSPWIQAAADYQELYSRETLTHVTEDPELTRRIIADLQSADGLTVAVPDLRSAGLTFKRVQRLSFRRQPVVQMVYLPEHGEPVAVCVTPDTRADEAPRAQQIGSMTTVVWRRNNLGYVLLGRGPAQTLMDVGRRIASGETSNLYGRRSSPGMSAPAA